MVDDKEYKFVSDKILNNLMKRMENFFEENDIDIDEDIVIEDEYLEEAVESYVKIKGSFIFVKEDIKSIVYKMDYAFGTI